MARSIQDLRRERGYRNAREFADALGISASSMSRYEKQPSSIPMHSAWAMADALGCSIDEVVGHESVTSAAGGLQGFYDALLPESRALMDEFIDFVRMHDERERQRRRSVEMGRYLCLARFYERMFYQAAYDEAGSLAEAGFVDAAEERTAFEAFVAGKAAEKRVAAIEAHLAGFEAETREGYLDGDGARHCPDEEELAAAVEAERVSFGDSLARKDEEVIAKVMDAYDQLHGGGGAGWAAYPSYASVGS